MNWICQRISIEDFFYHHYFQVTCSRGWIGKESFGQIDQNIPFVHSSISLHSVFSILQIGKIVKNGFRWFNFLPLSSHNIYRKSRNVPLAKPTTENTSKATWKISSSNETCNVCENASADGKTTVTERERDKENKKHLVISSRLKISVRCMWAQSNRSFCYWRPPAHSTGSNQTIENLMVYESTWEATESVGAWKKSVFVGCHCILVSSRHRLSFIHSPPSETPLVFLSLSLICDIKMQFNSNTCTRDVPVKATNCCQINN